MYSNFWTWFGKWHSYSKIQFAYALLHKFNCHRSGRSTQGPRRAGQHDLSTISLVKLVGNSMVDQGKKGCKVGDDLVTGAVGWVFSLGVPWLKGAGATPPSSSPWRLLLRVCWFAWTVLQLQLPGVASAMSSAFCAASMVLAKRLSSASMDFTSSVGYPKWFSTVTDTRTSGTALGRGCEKLQAQQLCQASFADVLVGALTIGDYDRQLGGGHS